MTADQVSELLLAFAQDHPSVDEVVRQAEQACWAIAIDHDLVITAELDANGERLGLSADLGRAAEHHNTALGEALLLYTSLGRRNAGISMGLSERGGEFIQMASIDLPAIDVQPFAAALLGFANKAAAWRRLIARGVDWSDASADSFESLIAMKFC